MSDAEDIDEDDIAVFRSGLVDDEYVAVRVTEVIDGRIVYPFVLTSYTHRSAEDVETVVKPTHAEYDDLLDDARDAEAENKLLGLSERDVKRVVSA